MRVVVDAKLCQGHTRCAVESEELFDLDVDGHATVRLDPVPPDLEQAAIRAELACPEQAIRLS
jgi:ferredoxin